jgi:putative transposase
VGGGGGRPDARGPCPPRQEPDALDRDRGSRSVTSGPRKGERGVDGDKKVEGIKRHLLTCSSGLVLAVLVSAANLHDAHGLAPPLDRAAEAGRDPRRVEVDAIHAGPTVRAAGERHGLDVQVSVRDPDARGFAPLPVRWRIEATSGTLTNRYRRPTRNLERTGRAAENVVEVANLRRVLRILARSAQDQLW